MTRRSNSKSDKNAYLEETTCGKAGGWALVGGWVHPFNYGHKLQIHNAHICKFNGEEIYIHTRYIPDIYQIYTYQADREKRKQRLRQNKNLRKFGRENFCQDISLKLPQTIGAVKETKIQ